MDYKQKLNDFLFCPMSLYLHSIYENFSSSTFHSIFQVEGKLNHQNIEEKRYSTAKKFFQGTEVRSEVVSTSVQESDLIPYFRIFQKNPVPENVH